MIEATDKSIFTDAGENQKPKPELFTSCDDISLDPSQTWVAVTVKVSPTGNYGDKILKIIGFEQNEKEEFWLGRGWIKQSKY